MYILVIKEKLQFKRSCTQIRTLSHSFCILHVYIPTYIYYRSTTDQPKPIAFNGPTSIY